MYALGDVETRYPDGKRGTKEGNEKREGSEYGQVASARCCLRTDPNDNSLMRFDCMHTVPVQESNGSLVGNGDNRLRTVVDRLDGVARAG